MPWKLLGEAWKWNIFYDMRHKSHQSYLLDKFEMIEWYKLFQSYTKADSYSTKQKTEYEWRWNLKLK